ncbi:Autophagy protein 7 [Knufia fluminis]|uniref:Ubiquitin-like modifier-activating enzyme ATG7 n=1 Tax=Knufia fluminis TaxID=191047 RepID=A0AAN8I2P6_9EURO|nr:Autophagy protein 7 [Knufia fluminis]
MQYVPFISDIEIPFYASLASQKINTDKLDDSPRPVQGLYEIRPSDPRDHSCRMQIHANALTTTDTLPNGSYYVANGTIKNVNTIEDYRRLDKVALLNAAGRQIWDAINDKDGTIYECPGLLASFIVICFADLKKYRFSYWFGFPALVLEVGWTPVVESRANASASDSGGGGEYVPKVLGVDEAASLADEVEAWKGGVDSRQWGFFVAKKSRRPGQGSRRDGQDERYSFSRMGFRWCVDSLRAHDGGFFEGEYSDDCFVCFADPSNYTSQNGTAAPGWMLRNLLVLVKQRWKRDRIQVLCYRETAGRRDAARSIIYDMEVSRPKEKKGLEPGMEAKIDGMPKVVGWERNANGKLAGRLADLTEYMDPKKLADSSVDLNLKLMKWRISPNLDLDKIKDTRCLLLGAGTLGSYVSRNLMGWGVRKITFVDNAQVSYSNPVRQPLFNFQDCQNGGKRKATRAAEALREIYPGVDATGHVMSVPMIGHPVTDSEKTKGEFEKLQSLIEEHDVIFLLMDTRESRWLPTVMGKAAGKVVMNAALGFDTYVVMRHGAKAETETQQELGCYFCNDVVAPQDSMQDRTLDQQCTVTRPGVAAIASALLVEVLVSVLQHPDGPRAAAPTSNNAEQGDHPLGLVPHQIRGFLSTFTNMNVVGKSYDCCSACSDRVIDAYKQDGWSFIEKALNSKDYVEELSGLKEVQRRAEAAAAEIEAAFEEGEDSDGELL